MGKSLLAEKVFTQLNFKEQRSVFNRGHYPAYPVQKRE
jgi:hypothetical protein